MMLLIIFGLIFVFNLAPAFTPPTWVVLSFIQVTYQPHFLLLALVGAIAATLGRMLLAKLAKVIIRDRFLGPQTIKNLDTIRKELEGRRRLTAGIFLFFAFSPLPSNQLFLAYGLTDLKLGHIAPAFFIGRFCSYLFWIVTASKVAQHVAADSLKHGTFFKSYFIVVQILVLATVYLFAKIDWQKLIKQRKISWVKKI